MPSSSKHGDLKVLKWDLGRDLTGVSSARVIFAKSVGATPVIDRNGSLDNPTPTAGIVSLQLQAGDFAADKAQADVEYLVEIETQPGPLTHPDDDYERHVFYSQLG